MKAVTIAPLFCLLLVLPVFAYQVVLKDGKVVEGTLVKEVSESIILKNAEGIVVNIKKGDIDKEKTKEANKKNAFPSNTSPEEKKQGVKKPPKVITREYLESLREKYDLGQGSFGEAYKINLGDKTKYADFSAEEDSDFRTQVLQAAMPVIVDFWAPWCGPCKVIAPSIEAVEEEYADRAKIYRVNIDEKPELASSYNVDAIPTLLYFKDGEQVDRIVGVAPQQLISSKLETLMN